jgi:hypothetical protein
MTNSFNDLQGGMMRSSELYVRELEDRSQSHTEMGLILFILSIAALLALIAILIPVVAFVN